MEFQNLPIAIENDKGQYRYWYDPDAKEHGKTCMLYPYGYVEGTLGLDGDEVDVFVGPHKDSERVFIITQLKRFAFEEIDEQKVMLGFNNPVEAKTAYLQHFNNARFFGTMKEMTISEFKYKLKSEKGKLIKSALINTNDSAKIGDDNMFYLDLSKAGEFKTSGMKPGSEEGSKTKYTVEGTSKAAFCEEEMDLKKDTMEEDSESEEKKSKDSEVNKSFDSVHEIAKALKASAVAGLSRRQRMDALYQAGVVVGRQNPIHTEPAVLTQEHLNVGIDKSRPLHEPPAVPVRRVETPFSIPPKECGDHAYRTVDATPKEALPLWRRQ